MRCQRPGPGSAVSRRQAGFNLIEVTIALALMAIVLLGLSSLFIRSMKSVSSGRELTEASGVGSAIMEDLEDVSFSQLYGNFGGGTTQTSLTISSKTNAYAARWQPMIDARLRGGQATVELTPLGGTATPPTFGSALTIRVRVSVLWSEGSRNRQAVFQTTRS